MAYSKKGKAYLEKNIEQNIEKNTKNTEDAYK